MKRILSVVATFAIACASSTDASDDSDSSSIAAHGRPHRDGGAVNDSGSPPAIAVHASASKSGATSVTFAAAPSGTIAGDYLVAQVVARGAAASTPPDVTWTKLASKDDGTGDVFQVIYGKPASSAASGAGTWTATGASSLTVTLTDVSGVSKSSPVRGTASTGGAAAIDFVSPSLAAQSGDAALVFVATSSGPRPWADSGTLFGVIPSGSVPAKWVDQTSLHTFEKLSGRKMAYGHSWLPWSFGSGFPTSSTQGPGSDFSEGRMSVFSWPSELSWPDGGASGNGDPTTTLSNIATGKYDSLIAANAQVLKDWGQPSWFRLFCEMNGGDHPWEVGHQTSPSITSSGAAAAYEKQFIAAWRRIWIITKGTAKDATDAGLAVTTFVHADNVLFHFNPQTYQTIAQVPRESLWPGDHYVDAAGTELYMRSSSGENTFDAHMTDTSSGNGTHAALYATFGPSGSLNQARDGMLGNGEGGNGGISGSMASMLDKTKGLGVRTSWKFFTYWNGGTSTIDNQSSSAQNDLKAFATDAWMSPELLVSFDAPSGFTDAYQYRYETDLAAGVNVGSAQSASTLVWQTVSGSSVSPVTTHGYGFGKSSVIIVALEP